MGVGVSGVVLFKVKDWFQQMNLQIYIESEGSNGIQRALTEQRG